MRMFLIIAGNDPLHTAISGSRVCAAPTAVRYLVETFFMFHVSFRVPCLRVVAMNSIRMKEAHVLFFVL